MLLKDSRVDLDVIDAAGRTVEMMLGENKKLGPQKIEKANKLFGKARETQDLQDTNDTTFLRKRIAVFVINSQYRHESGLQSLVGPLKDLEIGKKLFETKGYTIHIMKDKDL